MALNFNNLEEFEERRLYLDVSAVKTKLMLETYLVLNNPYFDISPKPIIKVNSYYDEELKNYFNHIEVCQTKNRKPILVIFNDWYNIEKLREIFKDVQSICIDGIKISKNCNPSDLKFLPKNIKCHYFHVGNIAKSDQEISGKVFHHPLSSLYFLKDKNFKFYSINDNGWSSDKPPSLEIELNEFKSIIPRFKILSGNPIISLKAKKITKDFYYKLENQLKQYLNYNLGNLKINFNNFNELLFDYRRSIFYSSEQLYQGSSLQEKEKIIERYCWKVREILFNS